MIFPPLIEVSAPVVEESGVPNKERVIFRPTQSINLVQFAIIVAIRQDNGSYNALVDNTFIFDDIIVKPPAWVVVFTGVGERKDTFFKGEPVHIRFWGRSNVMFGVAEVVPVIARIGQVMIGGHSQMPPSWKTLQQPQGAAQ
jgi:hypothetical protein